MAEALEVSASASALRAASASALQAANGACPHARGLRSGEGLPQRPEGVQLDASEGMESERWCAAAMEGEGDAEAPARSPGSIGQSACSDSMELDRERRSAAAQPVDEDREDRAGDPP